jgi:hypothetical protein
MLYLDCRHQTKESMPLIKGDMKNRNICRPTGYKSFIFLILENV